jgi:hypothetical protein
MNNFILLLLKSNKAVFNNSTMTEFIIKVLNWELIV